MARCETIDLPAAVAEAIDAGGLLQPRQNVLVGVSGGLDSVVLLDVLRRLAGEPARGYRLVVGHLDHGLRATSAEDATFVKDLADRQGLELLAERVETLARARAEAGGIEHAARMERYAFFGRACRDCSAEAVALAHHADDQAETVLFRILRGTSLRGLAGMAPRRELHPGVVLIRPLLGIPRQMLRDWAERQGLGWREDPSNAETQHRRNLLRHDVLPVVRKGINPAVEEALLRLADQARRAERFLCDRARAVLAQCTSLRQADRVLLEASRLAAEPAVVQTTAIRLALEDLALPERNLTAEHLDAVAGLLQDRSGRVNLPGDFAALRRGSQLLLLTPGAGG